MRTLSRTTITRSTASRRARNSASVRTGGRRRPASRPSRRRCRLASSRVEPLDALDLGVGRVGLVLGARAPARARRCSAGRPLTDCRRRRHRHRTCDDDGVGDAWWRRRRSRCRRRRRNRLCRHRRRRRSRHQPRHHPICPVRRRRRRRSRLRSARPGPGPGRGARGGAGDLPDDRLLVVVAVEVVVIVSSSESADPRPRRRCSGRSTGWGATKSGMYSGRLDVAVSSISRDSGSSVSPSARLGPVDD